MRGSVYFSRFKAACSRGWANDAGSSSHRASTSASFRSSARAPCTRSFSLWTRTAAAISGLSGRSSSARRAEAAACRGLFFRKRPVSCSRAALRLSQRSVSVSRREIMSTTRSVCRRASSRRGMYGMRA